MNSTWIVNYEGNEVRVENSWIKGEKLFVNNKLQDEKVGIKSSSFLSGHLISKDGSKKPIKAYIDSGLMSMKCRIFIDDEKVEVTQIR